jgi:NAD(P)-dependent dehydrogenase (short-subunit alcohol dehydrogenase family)
MKTALITGVSRGIGKATAEKFVKEGFNVIGVSQSGKTPFEHENLKVFKTDLSNPSSIKSLVENIRSKSIKIDILINNAGILIDKGSGLTLDVLRKTMEVNLFGLVNLTEQMIPCINHGGHIINLSSGLGSLTDGASGYYSAYRISKVAINMYTRTLAVHLSQKGIKVSSIDPGWVKTDMGGAGASRNPSEPAQEIFELATSNLDSGFFWYRGKKKSW